LIKPPKKLEVSLEHLGIHKSARGTSLGTKMIDRLTKCPKVKNQKRLVLDVSAENPRAQQLSERMVSR
jgi:ribosomal protein S18 acetylase RimI-like enzyme